MLRVAIHPDSSHTPVTDITGPWSTGGMSERRTFNGIPNGWHVVFRFLQCLPVPIVRRKKKKKTVGTSVAQIQTPHDVTAHSAAATAAAVNSAELKSYAVLVQRKIHTYTELCTPPPPPSSSYIDDEKIRSWKTLKGCNSRLLLLSLPSSRLNCVPAYLVLRTRIHCCT